MVSSTTKSSDAKQKTIANISKGKLSFKLMGCCVLLALLIMSACCMIGYVKYKNSTYQIYNEFAYQIANVASEHVDGNRIETYRSTKAKDAAYEDMSQELYTLYSNTGVTSIYICVPDPESLTIFNIYDARIHEVAEESKPYYDLGAVDPIGATNPQLIVDVYLTGKLTNDYFIRETDYGYNTSAVVPILDDSGKPTALLVVDVPMSLINEALREYLLFALWGSVIVGVVFLFFFLIYLRRGIIVPLNLISKEAASFVENDANTSEELLLVKTRDEIERLAKSIHQMEVDTRKYIENLTSVTAEKERIGAELNVATQIQASMLPAVDPAPYPERKDFDIFAVMEPAKEVGGDFYDFFMIDDDHLAVVVGDVSGKGVPASLFMVIAKTLIKDRALSGANPAANFTITNELLCEGNGGGLFVTGWLGIYEFSTRKLTYVNAGHNPPLIRRKGEAFEYVKARTGFVLAGMEGVRYRENETYLNPGDTLYIYTDGVTEATNSQEELFGEARLKAVLDEHADAAPEELLKRVHVRIDEFVKDAPQFDDITMLGLRINH